MIPKLYLCSLALLTFSYSVDAQLTSGMVAHWPFNGNLNDATGNGHTATTASPTYAAGVSGVANTAFDFGAGKLMQVANQPDLNMNKFTVCAVVMVDSMPTPGYSLQTILRRHNDPFSGGDGIYGASISNVFAGSGGSYPAEYVCYGLGKNSLNIGVSDVQYIPSTIKSKWYYMVVTYDSLTMRVYINGVLKKSYTGPGNPINNSTYGLTIGSNTYLNPSPFTGDYLFGKLDDLRLYNRALAQWELVQLPLTLKSVAVAIDTPIIDTTYIGASVNVNYKTSNAFNTGNVFTVEVSNSTGSFASATSIGNVTATTSGSISCNLPGGLTGARKMRIVATNPADTSFEQDIFIKASPIVNVTITALPSNIVHTGNDITFTANITNPYANPSYQWKKNGQLIIGATNDTFIANQTNTKTDDTISLVYKSHTNDSVESNKIVVFYWGNVSSTAFDNAIDIYPNPNNGNFTISSKTSIDEKLSVEITTVTGNVVYRDVISPANGKINKDINISHLPSGVYTIQLKGKENMSTQRFTKQ